MARKPKNVESRSLRSETQATDSTCSGWKAKRAAATRESMAAPVIRARTRKRTAAFTACSPAFTRWCAPGSWPKSWTSSMCDSQARGCQLATDRVVNAQRIPSAVSPAATTGLAVT